MNSRQSYRPATCRRAADAVCWPEQTRQGSSQRGNYDEEKDLHTGSTRNGDVDIQPCTG
jgi:hypothetical protein